MTYKKLFRELDEHTKQACGLSLIDELVLAYGEAVARDAIAYTAEFIGCPSFFGMRWWWEKPVTEYAMRTQEAIKKIAGALVVIFPKWKAEFGYMVTA